MTRCASTLDTVGLEQELRARGVWLLACQASLLQSLVLMRLCAGNRVTEGAGPIRIPLERIRVSADIVFVAGIAGAPGDGAVDLVGPREVAVTFRCDARGVSRQRSRRFGRRLHHWKNNWQC